jgi:Ca2+-binding EF-hand superfamily protein
MAPKLIAGKCGPKADVWSVGVIAFMLLSSSMPFYGKDRVQVIKKIVRGSYHFSGRKWRTVTQEAHDFVFRLLTHDPKQRPTANEALHDPWLSTDFNHGIDPHNVEQMNAIQASIQTFAGCRTLKKLALMMVAYKSTNEEIGFLKNMFYKFDWKEGVISLEEFKEALSEICDYTEEELEDMCHGIDIDGTGAVHCIEFLAATIETHGYIEEERLAKAFDHIDCHDSCHMTIQNLRDFLGEDVSDAHLDNVIHEADIEGDHCISCDEFLDLWDDVSHWFSPRRLIEQVGAEGID